MNIWQIIVIIIIALTVYVIIDNKREARQRRERNAKILPENGCIPLIRPDRLYNVVLSDGKAFCRVAVIGQMQQEDNPFCGWDGVFVLQHEDGRHVFVRQGRVRYIEEVQAACQLADNESNQRIAAP